MSGLITTIKVGLISLGIGFASLFGYVQAPPVAVAPIVEPSLGATFITPEVKALFSTTLASRITSSATSMTLSSATDKDGNTLASSTYGFIIDEGTSAEEFVLADCTGTACTNMTRGLSVSTATTSVSSLRFEHNRGASVKITTAPSLVFVINILKGKQKIEQPIKYSSSIATSTLAADRDSIASAGLVADTAFAGAGVINATTAAKGVVEIATAIETASSTGTGGSGAILVIPSSNATSSWNSASLAALKIPVADNAGYISSSWVNPATSTYTIGAFPAYQIGKNIKIFTSSGTFTVPSGVTRLLIEAVGAGAGAGGLENANAPDVAPGGGAGAYCWISADVTGTTTIGITIGAGGNGGTPPGAGADSPGNDGGTTTVSSYISAGGGKYSVGLSSGINKIGTLGRGGTGTASSTSSNVGYCTGGQPGGFGTITASTAGIISGKGGDSFFGYGAPPVTATGNGTNAVNYGAGGSGPIANGSNGNGGNGFAGFVKITW